MMAMAHEEFELNYSWLPFRVKGQTMFIIAILGVALGYIVWDVKTGLADHHSTMLKQSTQLQETMDEFVYIQSLTEQERLKLKLSMPDSLKRKANLRDNP
jgi:hypothetical protein